MRRCPAAVILALAVALAVPLPGHTAAPAPANVASPAASCAGITADSLSDPACDADMAAYPVPNAQPLAVGTLYPRVYGEVKEWTAVYDAPEGSVVRVIGKGYTFASLEQADDAPEGWVKINRGEWVRADRVTRVRPSALTGVTLPGALPYPMAWVLLDTYTSPFPGGPPQSDQLVYRYERVSIFAAVPHNGWNWYLIGPNRWIHQRRVGIVKHAPRPAGSGEHWIAIDLYEQVVTAYEGDRMVFAALISTGTSNYPTSQGLFAIERRYAFDDMTSGRATHLGYYYIEDVPWTMYFDRYSALHGVFWHNGFGFPQSHGCVNLALTDAEWLFNWTAATNPQAPVLVWHSG